MGKSNAEALSDQVERSGQVASWIANAGRKVKIKESVRASLVTGSIQLAMEHHAAMLCLAKGRHYASLLAALKAMLDHVRDSYRQAEQLLPGGTVSEISETTNAVSRTHRVAK